MRGPMGNGSAAITWFRKMHVSILCPSLLWSRSILELSTLGVPVAS